MSKYTTQCAEIIALFVAAGKEVPDENSDLGKAIQILQTICDSQSHSIPEPDIENPMGYNEKDLQEENAAIASDIFEALEEIENHIGDDDFNLDFDGNEYRIISDSEIWDIYVEEIKNVVEDCYSDVINIDKIPSFIAVTIDWEQTAKNAYVDGYGHHFSSYDGSEEEVAGYYIFRTN